MHKNLTLFILLCALLNTSYAGLHGFTTHSRANCINNESISWDATKARTLDTISFHYRNGFLQHVVDSGWSTTIRSAAIHWGEGRSGGWRVIGQHWMMVGNNKRLVDKTDVIDCSIYDGWWG